jgi:hypothetical protein
MPVFFRTMSTLLFVGTVAGALPAAAVPAPQHAAATSAVRSGMPALHLAARKGTRNYRPGDAGTPSTTTPSTTTPSTTTSPTPDKPADAADTRTLEGCMATWDKGTHISKSRWREICMRNANDRGQAEAGATR